MTRFDRLVLASLAALAAFACSGPPPAPAAKASPVAPPTPAPLTAEQSIDWYKKCWELFNTKAWDTFQNCYTPGATSDSVDSGQPLATGRAAIIEAAKATVAPYPDVRGDLQLMIASGNHLVSVVLWKGTHTAPMPGPDGQSIPPTGKKFGFLMAHTVELDAGRTAAQADADYVEVGTLLAQLGLTKAPARKTIESGAAEPTVAIAKTDEAEASNLAAVQAMFEAFNKHDTAAMMAQLGNGYVLHEVARPADMGKPQALASTKELFKGFADVKITTSNAFGAGDYVVVTGTFEGTNTGGVPSMGLKKNGKHASSRFLEIFRSEKGKIVEDWLFYNGAAMMAQLGAA